MSEQTSWQFVDFGEPLYLDGVQTQFAIENNGRELVYVKDAKVARLISAAPDLLEALRMAALLNCHGVLMADTALQQCEAAINKAIKEPTE